MLTFKLIFTLVVINSSFYPQSNDEQDYKSSFDRLYNIAKENKNSNYDSSIYYALQARSIANENDDDTLITDSELFLSEVYRLKNDNENAEKFLLSSIARSKEIDATKRLTKSYLSLGDFYETTGRYDNAISIYNEALEISRYSNDLEAEADILNSIGVAYKYKGEYPEALKWLYSSLRLSETHNDLRGQASALGNIANVNESLKKYKEAIEIYSRILNIFSDLGDDKMYANTLMNMGVIYFYQERYDEALEKFKESLAIAERKDFQLIASFNLNNIACTYEVLNDYEETLNYFDKALDLARKMENNWGIANTLNNLAATNIELKRLEKSKEYVIEALEIGNSIGSKDLVVESYRILSNVYMEKEDYKSALINFKLYKELNDSLFNEKNFEQIAEMNAKYETEVKEREIQALLIKKQQQIIVFISIILSLIFIIALFNYFQYMYKKKAAKLLKTIIDSLTHPFCVFTVPDMKLELANTAAEGKNSPYLHIVNDPEQIKRNPDFPYTFNEVRNNKKQHSFEKLYKINEKEIYYEFHGFPIFDPKDEVVKIIEYAVDITEEKKAIDKIKSAFEREKEINDLKSQFISSTSHEFRTPLATLNSSVELIQHYDRTKSENKKLYHISRIKEIVKYMTKMLDDILTINKADVNKLEFQPSTIDLRDFCTEIIEDIAVQASSQHYIYHQIEGNFKDVIMDTKLLRNILTNLLSNAIKYSPTGGQIFFKTVVEENEVIFTVKDEGIGIPKKELKNLFQHFFRASNVGTISGTGLGLAIVKKAVTTHGGTISFDSSVGKGTNFTVRIPLQRELTPNLAE